MTSGSLERYKPALVLGRIKFLAKYVLPGQVRALRFIPWVVIRAHDRLIVGVREGNIDNDATVFAGRLRTGVAGSKPRNIHSARRKQREAQMHWQML